MAQVEQIETQGARQLSEIIDGDHIRLGMDSSQQRRYFDRKTNIMQSLKFAKLCQKNEHTPCSNGTWPDWKKFLVIEEAVVR
jgi:hypothetical protein